MNGGFDYLCGRLLYYDEIINDYASNDSERIEYLKSITMVSAHARASLARLP
jgi:hypothetical protein